MDEFDHIFPIECIGVCPHLKNENGLQICDLLKEWEYICPLSAEEYNELKIKED
jgi:hypothetical protein